MAKTDADPGRTKLEAIAEEREAKEPRVPTPQEAAAQFSAEVRARLSTSGTKGVDARRVVMPGRMNLAQSQFSIWDVVPDFGTTPEQLEDPAYWAHCAKRLNVWDRIVARSEDGSWMAEFVVVERGNLYARVRPLPGYPMSLQVSEPDVDSSMPTGYAVKWTGPHSKYAVTRNGDKLRDRFENKGSASQWLREHLKGVAA